MIQYPSCKILSTNTSRITAAMYIEKRNATSTLIKMVCPKQLKRKALLPLQTLRCYYKKTAVVRKYCCSDSVIVPIGKGAHHGGVGGITHTPIVDKSVPRRFFVGPENQFQVEFSSVRTVP